MEIPLSPSLEASEVIPAHRACRGSVLTLSPNQPACPQDPSFPRPSHPYRCRNLRPLCLVLTPQCLKGIVPLEASMGVAE